MSLNRGVEFLGQASSSDASGTITLNYFTNGGASRTIAATEALFITDFNITAVTTGQVALQAWNGTANHLDLFVGTVAAKATISRPLNTPFVVPPTWTLKLVAVAGQVDAQVLGSIIKA